LERKKSISLIFLFYLPIYLLANSGSIVIPQGVPFFWVSSAIIILVEFILTLFFSPSSAHWKAFLYILFSNVTSTLAGLPLIVIYLKLWERLLQHNDSIFLDIPLFLIVFMIPSVVIEYLFYRKIFYNDKTLTRIVKTLIIHAFSYTCLIILIFLFNKGFKI